MSIWKTLFTGMSKNTNMLLIGTFIDSIKSSSSTEEKWINKRGKESFFLNKITPKFDLWLGTISR